MATGDGVGAGSEGPAVVGETVEGLLVGLLVGLAVGKAVGLTVSNALGLAVGFAVGEAVGIHATVHVEGQASLISSASAGATTKLKPIKSAQVPFQIEFGRLLKVEQSDVPGK